MNVYLVGVIYGTAFLLALALLYLRHTRWYWHILSLAAALALGLTRFPDGLRPPDLLVGFGFVFLVVWGAAEPLIHPFHSGHHGRHA